MVQIEHEVASAEGVYLAGVGGLQHDRKASAETWISMVTDFQKGSLSTRGSDDVHGQSSMQQYFLTVLVLELPGK
ncbi:hypothetical protein DVH24_026877 [Malus domestica]|uniref:Uncharacterized protein n=1 Tax=Malus domestica TaxID=3750 RepID=A0A498IK93_MALDO|nr:hypothetical protein DVH24_026877 [Malus domestica]